MQIFITGASGYAGSVIAERLVADGHVVRGLARSGEAAAAVRAVGAEPVAGSLASTEILRAEAGAADAIVHAAVDYADPGMATLEARAVDALIAGAPGKRLVYLSSTLVYRDTGEAPATEARPADPATLQPFKVAAERRVLEWGGTVLRPGLIHGRGEGQLLGGMLAQAREDGLVTFIGDGANRWSVVHVDDLAGLVARAVEHGPSAMVLNAVGDEAPSMRELAEAAARSVGGLAESVALEACTTEQGAFAVQLTRSLVADSTAARRRLGWVPTGPGVLEGLARRAPVPAR